MSKQLKKAFRPTVEALEQRNLMAVVLQLVNSGAQGGGTLVVEGGETADYIVVRQEGAQIYVTSQTKYYDIRIQATGKLQQSVPVTSVKNVLIRGNGGMDYIYFANAAGARAGTKPATIYGGSGADEIVGSLSAFNYIDGGSYDDLIYGGLKGDTLIGRGGGDEIYGLAGWDRLLGGEGFDYLWGGSGNDVVWGEGGDDELHGGGNNDQLIGGIGDDLMWGDAGDDKLWGEAGDDQLGGGTGKDVLLGGNDNDRLYGGTYNSATRQYVGDGLVDTLNGGLGADGFAGEWYYEQGHRRNREMHDLQASQGDTYVNDIKPAPNDDISGTWYLIGLSISVYRTNAGFNFRYAGESTWNEIKYLGNGKFERYYGGELISTGVVNKRADNGIPIEIGWDVAQVWSRRL